MSLLEVAALFKSYGSRNAVADIGFDLNCGNILGLLGPSGCGKTTLLRIIAGLEQADRGRVVFDGRDMAAIPSHRRQFGMMFQDFALFPHKNVHANVAFGLEIQGRTRQQIDSRTAEMLDLVGLQAFGGRNIAELSGGERQRVALARSLAPQPRLLLLDEPLGSLDRALRERLMMDLRRILKQVGVTAIFVTHDQAEAFAIADEVAVLHAGRLQQLDRPEVLFERPANRRVARFLGLQNLVDGSATSAVDLETDMGRLRPSASALTIGRHYTLLIRPEAGRLCSSKESLNPSATVISGVVRDRIFQGRTYRVSLHTTSGRLLIFDLPREAPPPTPGQPIHLKLHPSTILIMPD